MGEQVTRVGLTRATAAPSPHSLPPNHRCTCVQGEQAEKGTLAPLPVVHASTQNVAGERVRGFVVRSKQNW